MAELSGDSASSGGISSDNVKGLVLALSSSVFIGASFIVKKKGLKKAGSAGVRAGVGGYSYLYEPLWWAGMTTMIVGEIANFAAYAFAPAILVTPLGALSIIISAVLAHVILSEKLHIFGILGCVLCVVGSTTIVLHAPQERDIESVKEVWNLATEPAFLLYAASVIAVTFVLIFHFVPQYGQTHIMVYIGVCSLMGSLSVMSVKALGIALKLTFSGMNQLIYPQTWAFAMVVGTCVIIQMNYLNKALDTFNTAIVSPIYYVMFTSFTILASVIMFKGAFWSLSLPESLRQCKMVCRASVRSIQREITNNDSCLGSGVRDFGALVRGLPCYFGGIHGRDNFSASVLHYDLCGDFSIALIVKNPASLACSRLASVLYLGCLADFGFVLLESLTSCVVTTNSVEVFTMTCDVLGRCMKSWCYSV